MWLRAVIAALLVVLAPVASGGQPNTPAPPPTGPPTATASPATDIVAVPEPTPLAVRYHRTGLVLWCVTVIWGLMVPALFLFTGLSARIRTWAQAIGRRWFFVVGIYFAIFSLISFVVDLPLNYYSGFVRQHAYGQSNQTLTKWVGDSLIGLAVSIVIGCLFLWVPYLLLRRSPRRWWLYTGLLMVPFLVLLILVQPIWIDPLFNRFGPMTNTALESRILALAERAGIEGGRVYEVAKSEDTKALNAYVTGFGNTKRIVLWDTTIARLDQEELLFVMGHEMGHYVLGHVWKSILFLSAVVMVTLLAIHKTAGWLIGRYHRRFGFTQLADVASLPLILLLFGAYLFVVTPGVLAFNRANEHESDRFGLEILQDNHSAATAFVKLQTENLGIPRPHWLVRLWQASHPTLGERIDFCNAYRPWTRGEPLRYGHLFAPER